MKLRILLADDHAILREGLAMLINAQDDMEVVAQAATGREAVELAEQTRPDLAVLDVSMPNMGGAEAAREILARCPGTRVVALTRHADQGYLRNLLAAGATGYVLKQSAADTLVQAIHTVAGGGTYLEPSLAGGIVERAIGGRNGAEVLSDREQDVLRGIAWGRSNKEIAAELGISVKTVESYKATATHKLKLRTRSQIIRYALTRGWLSEDSES
jgi:DNA-binding NarL/FixJ family response regulator